MEKHFSIRCEISPPVRLTTPMFGSGHTEVQLPRRRGVKPSYLPLLGARYGGARIAGTKTLGRQSVALIKRNLSG